MTYSTNELDHGQPATDASTPAASGNARRNAPTHGVYHVRDLNGTSSKGKKGFWTRIGSAWPHSDGQGFSLQMDCVPLDGRLNLRILDDKSA